MPPTAPEFRDSRTNGSYKRLGQDYFLKDSDRVWENLRVTNFISRNVIRIALQVELAKSDKRVLRAFPCEILPIPPRNY